MKLILITTLIMITVGCSKPSELSSERTVQLSKIFNGVPSLKKSDKVFLSKLADSCELSEKHKRRVEIYSCLSSASSLGSDKDNDQFSALLRKHGVSELASIVQIFPFGGYFDTNEYLTAIENYIDSNEILLPKGTIIESYDGGKTFKANSLPLKTK